MRDFKATGSYLEVGRQIGAAFKREIREYIELRYDQMSYELQECGIVSNEKCINCMLWS